jgi:glycosyltransferase involved in cell wall biosynthesis
LLLTSTHEGSPNIVKEALACNLPVVSVKVGDVEERICGVENCYITTSEPNDIADKLYSVITSSRRANNGFEKVSSINSEIIAKKIIMIYNQILK